MGSRTTPLPLAIYQWEFTFPHFTMAYFKTYKPSPSLQHVIAHYWRAVVPLQESLVQEVATPLMQGMTFNLNLLAEEMVFGDRTLHMDSYCYLFGQPAKHRLSVSNRNGVDILGIKFTPLGIYQLTGLDMRHLADDIIDAGELWGKEVEWLCEALYEATDTPSMIQIVERFLSEKLGRHNKREANPALTAAIERMSFGRLYTLTEIREITCMSKKTLERCFLTHIGLSPKRYARICRFNTVKTLLDQNPNLKWQEVAFSLDYYDQSHFIKEFKEFAGKPPVEYHESLRLRSATFF